MSKLNTVIMAGGSGTRLWPLSRRLHPKQFIALTGADTLLQATLNRTDHLPVQTTQVICNQEHRFFVAEQLAQQGRQADIVLEPAGRNTAPAIALAALNAVKKDPQSLLLVLAADHSIDDEAAFAAAVQAGIELAENGKLVTFGIVPTAPHTAYGYIRQGAVCGAGFAVEQFVEKPDKATAAAYFGAGNYLWNSGMFLFKASRYLEELGQHQPAILAACTKACEAAVVDLDFIRVDAKAFAACPAVAVDYAVMEHTQQAVVVPLDAGWSDVGCWSSLWHIAAKNSDGNVHYGDVFSDECHNNYIRADARMVAAVGVSNLVIVDTADALLVAAKDRVQDVKNIVARLQADGRPEVELHREVHRPWGKYNAIDSGERYQVKRLTVKAGAGLSRQMHHHRAEHWIVVSGTARVTIGENTVLLSENESTYIPVGVVHALENPGKLPLELIEVQSGSYLGEDDIVRFEDRYGRA